MVAAERPDLASAARHRVVGEHFRVDAERDSGVTGKIVLVDDRVLRTDGPTSVDGAGQVEAVQVEPTGLVGGRLVATGPATPFIAQLLLRSVGYRGIPIPGRRSTPRRAPSPISTAESSAMVDPPPVSSSPHESGRDPVDVLGTKRADATQVAERIVEDAAELGAPTRSHDIVKTQHQRGIGSVTNVAGA